MKILLFLIVIAAAAWLVGKRQRGGTAAPRRAAAAPPPAPVPMPMQACARCGLHLPQAEALLDAGGLSYCSEAHRLAGPSPASP
jgi:uncharacterized protein